MLVKPGLLVGRGLLAKPGFAGQTGLQAKPGLPGQTGFAGQTGLQAKPGLAGQTEFAGQTGLQAKLGFAGQAGVAGTKRKVDRVFLLEPLSTMVFSPFLLPQEELRPIYFAGWPVTSTFLDISPDAQVIIIRPSHSKGFVLDRAEPARWPFPGAFSPPEA